MATTANRRGSRDAARFFRRGVSGDPFATFGDGRGTADRLSRAYGTRLDRLLDGVESVADLGRHFGAGLYERELRYLVEQEFARSAEDVLWRRTKLGLRMNAAEQQALAAFLESGS